MHMLLKVFLDHPIPWLTLITEFATNHRLQGLSFFVLNKRARSKMHEEKKWLHKNWRQDGSKNTDCWQAHKKNLLLYNCFFFVFFFTSATLPVLMYCSFHSPLANPVKECCSQSNHVCKINLFSQDYRRHFADLGLIWSFVMRVIESKMTKQILLRPWKKSIPGTSLLVVSCQKTVYFS